MEEDRKKTRTSVYISPYEASKLNAIAAKFNAVSASGPTAGQPSWRSLLSRLADGSIVCLPVEDHSLESVDSAQIGSTPGVGRSDYKGAVILLSDLIAEVHALGREVRD